VFEPKLRLVLHELHLVSLKAKHRAVPEPAPVNSLGLSLH
jgi:hypothetical protein